MNEGLIAYRYAKALLKYAQDKNQTGHMYEIARQTEESFAAHPDLQCALVNPVLKADKKERLLLTAAGIDSASSEEYLRFVRLLLSQHRECHTRAIMLVYQKLYRELNHIVKASVVTASSLDKATLDRIEAVVATQCKDKTLELEHIVDENIIGGFVLNVDGRQLDASIEKELKILRLKLINSKTKL